MPVLVLLTTLSIFISLILTMGTIRTYKVQSSPKQKQFITGTIKDLPNGDYQGKVSFKTSWIGKTFNVKDSTGINRLNDSENNEVEKFPFKTYLGKAIQDKNLEVIKIDYNLPENPLWVRFILDEIVEVERGRYLGKVHIRILPNIAFSLGYFELEKSKK